jgi:hypothetical protein
MTTLCETFRLQAFWTWGSLAVLGNSKPNLAKSPSLTSTYWRFARDTHTRFSQKHSTSERRRPPGQIGSGGSRGVLDDGWASDYRPRRSTFSRSALSTCATHQRKARPSRTRFATEQPEHIVSPFIVSIRIGPCRALGPHGPADLSRVLRKVTAVLSSMRFTCGVQIRILPHGNLGRCSRT